ncbi:MAG: hypothetical protein LKF00_09090 [Olsenella sp.]|nr:hypothetical protein [Olsenella sp.]MCI1289518.1 hypothetical protein [Olsenella sp.]
MSMMAPEVFIDELDGMTYQEMMAVREGLVRELRFLEGTFSSRDGATSRLDPSSDLVYRMDLIYLSELLQLMETRSQEFTGVVAQVKQRGRRTTSAAVA